jgi:hypothetical protein
MHFSQITHLQLQINWNMPVPISKPDVVPAKDVLLHGVVLKNLLTPR